MRVGQDQAGQGDLLGLSGREGVAARPDRRVQALGQRLDPAQGVDGVEGGRQGGEYAALWRAWTS